MNLEFPEIHNGFAQGEEMSAAGKLSDAPAGYLAKNWFHPEQVGMMVAPPAQGKTAIAAALAAHLSLGHEFAGLKVKRSYVYYLAPEDAKGVKNRAYPYLKDFDPVQTPFSIVSRVPNFQCKTVIESIIVDVNERRKLYRTPHAFIVVDTTNLAIGDADENSATVVGNIISNARRIAVECQSYVLFIHHTSHGDLTRGRGSSAFRANMDDEFLLKKPKGSGRSKVVELAPVKQKNTELQDAIVFEIESFEVGNDDEGDKVTVPRAVPLTKPAPQTNPAANDNRGPVPVISVSEKRENDILRVLVQLNEQFPGSWHDSKALRALTGEAFNAVRNNSESFRKVTKKALDALVQCGNVERNDKKYRICPPPRRGDTDLN